MAIHHVVEHNYRQTLALQGPYRVAADIAGPTGHQNCHDRGLR